MATKLTRLTYKIGLQLPLVPLVAPGGQSGNFWIHPCSVLLPLGERYLTTVAALPHIRDPVATFKEPAHTRSLNSFNVK